ncbi:hypothetical protein OG357_23010 [Streptomyces sp. NBC_01255]|uniref:hypothetical protein n=1 Tax=Streptomyces sp. NBC_01255 TaxID=2903798 RepID=UPI002E363859|nr:hypothetical protein [Streptomyces sp. NBC_01255]
MNERTTPGSTPAHSAHPSVIAARHALCGKLAAEITDRHDITDPAPDEKAVRGYIVEPRAGDLVAVYWLEKGRAVRRDTWRGNTLDRLADHLTREGWTVEPMLRTSLCLHAHRPAETVAPEAALTEWERDLLAADVDSALQRYTTCDENAAVEDIVDIEARYAAELVTEAEATDGTWRGEWIGDQPTAGTSPV